MNRHTARPAASAVGETVPDGVGVRPRRLAGADVTTQGARPWLVVSANLRLERVERRAP